MEFKQLVREKNPLLKREDVHARIRFDGALPSRQDVLKALAETLGVEEDRIVLFTIRPFTGRHEAHVEAAVYEDEALKQRLTPAYLEKRNAPKDTGEVEG